MKDSFRIKVAGLLFFLLGGLVYAQINPELEASTLRFIYGATYGWRLQQNSSNQLELYQNSVLGAVVMTVDDTAGDLAIRTRTAAQLAALAPSAANTLIVNSTNNELCISTGTGAGAWVSISTNVSTGETARDFCDAS